MGQFIQKHKKVFVLGLVGILLISLVLILLLGSYEKDLHEFLKGDVESVFIQFEEQRDGDFIMHHKVVSSSAATREKYKDDNLVDKNTQDVLGSIESLVGKVEIPFTSHLFEYQTKYQKGDVGVFYITISDGNETFVLLLPENGRGNASHLSGKSFPETVISFEENEFRELVQYFFEL